MSEEWRKRIGHTCIGLGLVGIALEVYLNQKLRTSVEHLRQNVMINPSRAQYNEAVKDQNLLSWPAYFFGSNILVYLNGPVAPIREDFLVDYDFGFAHKCICMIRKIEKLQWDCDENGNIVEFMSESPINSRILSEDHKPTPWLLNSEMFNRSKFCTLNTFQIRTKIIAPHLSYSTCYFYKQESSFEFDTESAENNNDVLRPLKLNSPRIRDIFQNEVKYVEILDKFTIINTKTYGNYRLSYAMAASNQRISLLGFVNKDKVIPLSKDSIGKGDVGLEVFLEKIDTKFNWNLALTLISVVWFGFSISY